MCCLDPDPYESALIFGKLNADLHLLKKLDTNSLKVSADSKHWLFSPFQ
jgi:hypothetical protein